MPGLRRTNQDAFRQLANVEKHDNPQRFADALGARRKPRIAGGLTNRGSVSPSTSMNETRNAHAHES